MVVSADLAGATDLVPVTVNLRRLFRPLRKAAEHAQQQDADTG